MYASRQIGSSWQALSIGDIVPSDSTLRLDAHSYVEITAASLRIALSQPGTCAVKKLLSMSRDQRSAEAGKALTEKLSRFVSRPSRSRGSAGGARAEMAGSGERQELSESKAEEFLADGKDFIGSGQYDQAVEELKKAVAAATDELAPRREG